MHGPRRLEVVDIQSTQVTIRWEPLGYNVTRCHSYNLTVQYRSKVGGKEETREEVCYDTQSRDPQHTIHNLTPFTNLSVKLVLRNPEGVMESKELEVQTDEDGKHTNTKAEHLSLKISDNTSESTCVDTPNHPRARDGQPGPTRTWIQPGSPSDQADSARHEPVGRKIGLDRGPVGPGRPSLL